ncbi:hypothetical protein CG427_15740 [Pantoea ananatis]|nr:hypothetical protein CG427_15740 [Pantoea ananatis]
MVQLQKPIDAWLKDTGLNMAPFTAPGFPAMVRPRAKGNISQIWPRDSLCSVPTTQKAKPQYFPPLPTRQMDNWS